ncbi:hypothetical protein EXW31_00330 (plasmid) [Bacillus mycoides]|uniref:toxin-antitoxin system TumE family protein n=1 Tax=Bacillus mycoides TaxID=1405 RepID=UPI001C01BE3B|nr:DUF6516 family protein [Bacillus mycoides]QWG42932.1 hypothetical protein EXW31_00330 [Bacillus mycoides]
MSRASLQSLGIPATDFNRIETEFADIILQMTQINRSMVRPEYMIRFKNGYRFEVSEVILLKNHEIGVYHYNLYDNKDVLLFQFHSERHEDHRYQTDSEPHHVHKPKSVELSTMDRMSNFYHRDLYTIMECLRYMFTFAEHNGKQDNEQISEEKVNKK